MKILHINSSGFKEGGAEALIVLTRAVLENRGHTVKVLTSDRRPELPHFNDYEYKTPSGLFSIPKQLCNISAYTTLRKVLKEFKPDVVHVNTIGYGSPCMLLALRGYPTVATIHGPEGYTKTLLLYCLSAKNFKHREYLTRDLTPMGRMRYFYLRHVVFPAFRLCTRYINIFITPSAYLQTLMRKEGVESLRIPNGTTLLTYRPLHKDRCIPYTLLFAGRLETYKGLNYLIQALPALVAHFPNTHLYVAGDGPSKADFEALTASLGLEDYVTFCGHVHLDALEVLYEMSSVVVVPSSWTEAFGLVGIEAMSVGRPVVASDIGGISDWLTDGKTGILVSPKNPQAITDAVITLFSDPDMIIRMGEEGRRRSGEFDIERYVDRIEEVYKDVIEGKFKKR